MTSILYWPNVNQNSLILLKKTPKVINLGLKCEPSEFQHSSNLSVTPSQLGLAQTHLSVSRVSAKNPLPGSRCIFHIFFFFLDCEIHISFGN